MRLRVLLPTEVLVDEAASKIVAESVRGSFCLLPRHIDFVEVLVPSILTFVCGGNERWLAVDGGILVKQGSDVVVSTPRGVHSRDLLALEEVLTRQFTRLDEREKRARSAVAHLEAELARKSLALRAEAP